jgi:hypothetical protein
MRTCVPRVSDMINLHVLATMLQWRAIVLATKKNPRFYVSAFLWRATVCATRNKALYQ